MKRIFHALPALVALALSACGGDNAHAQTVPLPYYGVNAHYTQGGVYSTNIPQQVADMQAMGFKNVRQDTSTTAETATLAGLITSFAPITIQPVFNALPDPTATESTSYDQFWAYGQTVAGQLAGKVPVIEMLNEPELSYPAFACGPSGDGSNITQWSCVTPASFASLRGALRGFYDGFRSIDTTYKTLIAGPAVGWLHFGLTEALWDGTAPDGTSGHDTVNWDLTNHHWYKDDGDILSAGGYNVLAEIGGHFNLPIILTEIGVQKSVTASAYNSYVNSSVAQYSANMATYNIIAVDWYELYNFEANPPSFYMGLYKSPGVVNGTRASTMTGAIASYPH